MLKSALASGQVSQARLDDMASRILRSLYASGAVDDPVKENGVIDFAANEAVSQADIEQGIVLLKNEGNLLPLGPGIRNIVVIGGHADTGVLAGSGSSLVYPRGGNAVPGLDPTGWPGPVMYFPSSPVAELQRMAQNARVSFVDGTDPAAAAAAAKAADVAIVFATQWSSESIDVPMALDGNQDALIEAVVAANPRTAVVLETNAGVAMPWAARVPAIVEAWYPGSKGGAAIANVLTGRVNPSGHLPVTFYASEAQLPRPVRPGKNSEMDEFPLPNAEGAAVGYKWVDKNNVQPLFPFGHGLSYTTFHYTTIAAEPAPTGGVRVRFGIHNGGSRAGMAVGQVYASPANGGWEAPKRLVGFAKVELAPNAAQTMAVDVDPRLLATFDEAAHAWRIAPGSYTFALGSSSRDLHATTTVTLPALTLPANWRPEPADAAQAPMRGERGR
jgi:beta-glucosidase